VIDRETEPCRLHRGEPAHNCGCCRSEQIANPDSEPDRLPPVPRSKPHVAARRAAHLAAKEAT
jgi:hypothetical protein